MQLCVLKVFLLAIGQYKVLQAINNIQIDFEDIVGTKKKAKQNYKLYVYCNV